MRIYNKNYKNIYLPWKKKSFIRPKYPKNDIATVYQHESSIVSSERKFACPRRRRKKERNQRKCWKRKPAVANCRQNTSFFCFPLDRNIRRENIIHYEELGEKRCTHRSKRTGGWPPMQWNEASGVSRGGSLSLSLSPSRIQKCSFFLFHVYLKWYMGLGSKLDPLGCELGSELDPFGMRTNVKHLSHVHILRESDLGCLTLVKNE